MIYSQGWFIFTTILLLVTLRSTVAFFTLFFTLDLAFLFLGIGYLQRNAQDAPNTPLIKTGGFFGLLSAFTAWYNALAGLADDSNRYVPLLRFYYLGVEHSADDLAIASSSFRSFISRGPARAKRCAGRRASIIRRELVWWRIIFRGMQLAFSEYSIGICIRVWIFSAWFPGTKRKKKSCLEGKGCSKRSIS